MCLEKQIWKCYYSNIDLHGGGKNSQRWMQPSIERINNNEGYTKENIAIVSQFSQHLKNAYPMDEFKRGIKSIATNELQHSTIDPERITLGGPVNRKGQKKWRGVDLDKPIKMISNIQAYIFNVCSDQDEPLSQSAIYDLIKDKYYNLIKKDTLRRNLIKLDEYIEINKDGKSWNYKLKSTQSINEINSQKKFECGHCKKEYNITHAQWRPTRGENPHGIDLNNYWTVCTTCDTLHSNKCRNRDPSTFILKHIVSKSKKKQGNATRDNILQAAGMREQACYISTGIPLVFKTNSGQFNQASPDRINSKGKYNVENVGICCLMINLGRNNYDITNSCIINIIKAMYANISRF